MKTLAALVCAAALVAGCGSGDDEPETPPSAEACQAAVDTLTTARDAFLALYPAATATTEDHLVAEELLRDEVELADNNANGDVVAAESCG